jgi:CheY-like chemotaxis protein
MLQQEQQHSSAEQNAPVPVLIVDDDVWMQRILSRIVESIGFEPIVASDGYEAIALALERSPAVIFLDIIMPELSGHQTLKLLKRLSPTRSIPVLVITAMSDTENLGLAIKEGAAGFIRKPFTRALIMERLQELLGEELVQKLATARLHQRLGESPAAEPASVTPSPPPPAQAPPMVSPEELLRRYQGQQPSSAENLEVVRQLLSRSRRNPPEEGQS